MANSTITGLTAQTTLLDTDVLVVVDTTDHSMSLNGTDKKITAANVIQGVKTALVTVPNTLVPFGDSSSDLTTDANFNYASSTLTAPTIKGSTALQVKESGGTDTISLVSPASIPASYTLTLPDQVGTSGQVFSTSGLGVVTYTSTASAPTASTIMLRDVNGNAQVNVLGRGVTSTATAAGTTTLLPSSTANQIFTGVTTQTVRLPDVTAANMAIGMQWIITNQSTGVVTVQTNSGAALSPAVALAQNQSAYCTVVSLSNNLATSWVLDFIGTTTGSAVSSLNTLNGALTMSQVVAVNDAGSAGGSNSIQIGSSSAASSTDSIALGRSASATTGTGNIALGQGAQATAASGAISIGQLAKTFENASIAIGNGAMGTSGGGIACIAIGTSTLDKTTGQNNTGVGAGCGLGITAGADNTLLGANVLATSTTGSLSSVVAIGSNSLGSANVTTGANGAVAIGHKALYLLTSGAHNTHVGYNGGNTVATTTGSDNTYIGYGITAGAARSNNTVVGSQATVGLSISGGCAFGASAAATSADCIAIGRAANSISGTNIAIGPAAHSTSSSGGCIAIGISSVTASGQNGIAIGTASTATQSGAIAIGNSADSITGTNGIAIGTNAQSQSAGGISIGNAATVATGSNAIAIGSLANSINGIAIGPSAMATSGGGTACIAIGNTALGAVTGHFNTAVGHQAGQLITTGVNNCIFGTNALDGSNTGCSDNTVFGYSAAGSGVTTAANGLVAIGSEALNALTSGARNTHLGYNGGSTVATTTGDDCTFVGYGITSAATVSDNTIVGSLATAATFGGCSILGKGATATADNQLVLRVGDSATTELVTDLTVTAGTPVPIGTEPYITVVIGGNSYKIALRS